MIEPLLIFMYVHPSLPVPTHNLANPSYPPTSALMLENIFGTSTRRVNVDQMEPIELEDGYDGPHISFPLTIDQVRGVCCGVAGVLA